MQNNTPNLTRTQADLLGMLADRGAYQPNCGWTYSTTITRGMALLNLTSAGYVLMSTLSPSGSPDDQAWVITELGRKALADHRSANKNQRHHRRTTMKAANEKLIWDMHRAIDACAELDRRGIHIHSASANADAPLITIAEPPDDAIQTFATAVSMNGPYRVATIRGVRVEWAPKIGRQAA